MGKGAAIAEIGIIVSQVIKEINETFKETISDDFFKVLDKLTYVTNEELGLNSFGSFSGDIKTIAMEILLFSNLVLWGIVLAYGIRCFTGYFFQHKNEQAWNFFIRLVIIWILTNGAYLLCFQMVNVTENITEWIRSIGGMENTSFIKVEERIERLDLRVDVESEDETIYSMESFLQIIFYFLITAVSFSLGVRYLVIRILVITAPVFFVFAGSKFTENIFFKWLKMFIFGLSVQIFIPLILFFVAEMTETKDVFSKVILIAGAILISKVASNTKFFSDKKRKFC